MPLYKSTHSIGTGWDDYTVAGLDIRLRGSNDPTLKEFRDGLYLYAFSGTVGLNEAFVSIHILHDYAIGTAIYPHIHWAHNIASPSGDVVWQVDYSIAKGFSQETFPDTTTITTQETAGTQYYHQITEFPNPMPAGSLEADTVVLMRVYRDSGHGNDNFLNDAFLVQVDLHYESQGRRTSDKQPPFTKIL